MGERRGRLRRLAGAVVVAIVLFGAVPATAQTDLHRDAVGDAWNPESGTVDTGPRGRLVDIESLRSRHAGRWVELRLEVVDLGTAFEEVIARYTIKTPRARYTLAVNLGRVGSQIRSTTLYRGSRGARCQDIRLDASGVDDVLTVRVPRTCLERPAWVRTGATLKWKVGVGLADDARATSSPQQVPDGGGTRGGKRVLGPRLAHN